MIRWACVIVVWLCCAGCPSVETGIQKSVVVEAKKTIGTSGVGERPEDPDATLEAVFSGAAPVPTALGALQFGMDLESARVAVEMTRDPEVPLFESDREGATLLGGQLPTAKGVGFTAIVRDTGGLTEVDLSVPAEGAEAKLTALWGAGKPGDELGTVVWDNSEKALQVVLYPETEGKSVVKFIKRAK